VGGGVAQILKEEVRERITQAALAAFARDGFTGTRMAHVARNAGVATGNLYRYFSNKNEMFYSLVDDTFVARLMALFERRIAALDGVDDIAELAPDAEFFLFAEDLLRFCIDNRLRVVILLQKTAGTRHDGFADRLVTRLTELAIKHFGLAAGDLGPTTRFNLQRIYSGFVDSMAAILSRFESETDIRRAVDEFSNYHLTGVRHFFA